MNRECAFEEAYEMDGEAFANGGDHSTSEGAGAVEGSTDVPREGTVKWFRSDKGYGFVALSGMEDAFLHLKSLQAAGRELAPPGAKVVVVVEQGSRGLQVTRVLGIDETSAPVSSGPFAYGRRAHGRPERNFSSAIDLTGRVKWFDDVRGFGFVACDDFGRDVFVHCTVVDASGLDRLDEGQTVSMRVIETPKGREAIQISL